jgi:protein-S-isoprenylcysteine O-methyltransferase Ste14
MPPDKRPAMTRARYIVGVLLLISLPPGVAWWFVIHPFVGFWRKAGVKPTMWVVSVGSAVAMIVLWAAREPLMGRDLGDSWILGCTAVLLFALAVAIGLRRKRHLTTRILAGIPELQADGRGGDLLTEGPYAVIRHPRYVEVALAVLAYALFANYVGTYVVAVATPLALHAIVLLEERELLERFGDAYVEYSARVPRYIPRFSTR